MNTTESVQKFWEEFCAKNSDVNRDEPYQVWYFGITSEMEKELTALVLQGKKYATASLVWEYEDKPEDAPVVGGYSVVTDFEGNPKCVVRTTELRVLPFNEVDAQFAFDEGEGDQSLDFWRRVHWYCFSEICPALGKEPSQTMLVNCERFELLFPSKTTSKNPAG